MEHLDKNTVLLLFTFTIYINVKINKYGWTKNFIQQNKITDTQISELEKKIVPNDTIRELLKEVGAGIIWIVSLLATLITLNELFSRDFNDGTLEQINL